MQSAAYQCKGAPISYHFFKKMGGNDLVTNPRVKLRFFAYFGENKKPESIDFQAFASFCLVCQRRGGDSNPRYRFLSTSV